ncbi:acyltransferase family protein [Pseudochelatococcus sp. B33]
MVLHLSPPPPYRPDRTPRLVLVQVLRAIAALFIVFVHAQFDAIHFGGPAGFVPIRALPWEVGVDIFFVISGFVIVHATRGQFGRPGAARTFMARRLIRIVPLYWLATALFLLVALARPGALNSPPPTGAEIAASFLFMPHINSLGVAQPVLTLGWTLNYEMAFYVVFAAAMAAALPRRQTVLAVALFFAALTGLGLLVALPMPLSFWANPMALEFVAGMGIALARDTGGRPGIILRAVLAAAAIRMLHADLTQDGIERSLALGVPAAMLVVAAVFGPEPRLPPPLARLLVLLGDASYALYLFHPFALRTTRLMLSGTEIAPWAYIAIATAAAVVLAVAIHVAIEKPVMGYLRRRLEEGRQ